LYIGLERAGIEINVREVDEYINDYSWADRLVNC